MCFQGVCKEWGLCDEQLLVDDEGLLLACTGACNIAAVAAIIQILLFAATHDDFDSWACEVALVKLALKNMAASLLGTSPAEQHARIDELFSHELNVERDGLCLVKGRLVGIKRLGKQVTVGQLSKHVWLTM